MTTAVLTRSTATAEGARWDQRGLCRTARADRDFFGATPTARARARRACLACPVLLTCLTRRADEEFGVVGGLEAEQRRALEVAALLGARPDLDRAQELFAPWWRTRLLRLAGSGHAPARIAEVLTSEGIAVDAVTVRVALWWAGAPGGLVGQPADEDQRPLWQRVLQDHGATVQRLRVLGVRQAAVADYLGIGIGTYNRIVQHLKASA